MREVIPGIEVYAWGHGVNNSTWSAPFDAPPRSKVNFKITIRDDGNTPLTDVLVADHLPSGARYINGSARVAYSGPNSSNTQSQALPSTIAETGSLGSSVGTPLPTVPATGYWAALLNGQPASLLPGETATVTLEMRLGSSQGALANTVEVRWQGNQTPASQKTTINVQTS